MKNNRVLQVLWWVVLGTSVTGSLAAQDTTVYNLTIKAQNVTITGKEVMGMTVNGTIPGPELRFKEGDHAVINVTNEMKVETSVHWHGLLLPNFYDGVPYLTTPPIAPGTTFRYEFPLIQSGTYWYHSHTMLQEQSGVYGAFVIEPKEEKLAYDRELTLLLSDWTNEKPMNVLRNLKRGNEWYTIKKGTATPLNQVIARGGLKEQISFWRQRMESADIADIYYPAFLTNGQQLVEFPSYKPGERVRIRLINGAASSQFWITWGGGQPELVSADGLNVVPVKKDKVFIAIAESYDFILTIPHHGKIEFRAMAQDGSGFTQAYIGSGEPIPAEVVPRPDKIGMMMEMAKMDMRMGAPAMKFNPDKEEPYKLMKNWGMDMANMKESMPSVSKERMQPMPKENNPKMEMEGHSHHQKGTAPPVIQDTAQKSMNHKPAVQGGNDHNQMNHLPGTTHHGSLFSEYNYNYLKSSNPTTIHNSKPVQKILLNLTGNMWRYIWSLNGVPLSEADMIKIQKGSKVQITFNNLTMMHHPMHLHGHFFRVINTHGERSPLKHTVNVAPMQKTVIEFDATEDSDWFLHCHVLYHMMGGMARAISYQTARNPKLAQYPLKTLLGKGNSYYHWGLVDIASHMTEINLVSSSIRNQFNLSAEVGYNQNLEAELSYERYLYDYLRVFVGANMENTTKKSWNELELVGIAGIRFLTPYMFNLDLRIDHKLRPELRIGRELMVFPRLMVFGNYEFQSDFGLVTNPTNERTGEETNYESETTWSAGLEYFLNRNYSVLASYDNRFGAGGGLSIRF